MLCEICEFRKVYKKDYLIEGRKIEVCILCNSMIHENGMDLKKYIDYVCNGIKNKKEKYQLEIIQLIKMISNKPTSSEWNNYCNIRFKELDIKKSLVDSHCWRVRQILDREQLNNL